jgi:hypothetical protein
MGFGIYELYRIFQPGLRQRRVELLLQRLQPGPTTRILDVGGFATDWEGVVPIQSPITFLNIFLPPSPNPNPARYQILVGDGRALDFPDRSFDLLFSNSVIEHVGEYEDQQRFAAEARRVGKDLFIQTPNRWFFVEPHFIALFVHYLPRRLSRRLLPWCSFRGLFRSGDNIELKSLAQELRLLSLREFKELFPDCEIYREKWFGLTKSFIAIRRWREPKP